MRGKVTEVSKHLRNWLDLTFPPSLLCAPVTSCSSHTHQKHSRFGAFVLSPKEPQSGMKRLPYLHSLLQPGLCNTSSAP